MPTGVQQIRWASFFSFIGSESIIISDDEKHNRSDAMFSGEMCEKGKKKLDLKKNFQSFFSSKTMHSGDTQ